MHFLLLFLLPLLFGECTASTWTIDCANVIDGDAIWDPVAGTCTPRNLDPEKKTDGNYLCTKDKVSGNRGIFQYICTAGVCSYVCTWPPIWTDTQICGRNYLDMEQIKEHPCQLKGPHHSQCLQFSAFFTGKDWIIPNPYHYDVVSHLRRRLDVLERWDSKLISMDKSAFCDLANWEN